MSEAFKIEDANLVQESNIEKEKTILFQRWNDYQQDGKSVSHEEVSVWLKSWGTEAELPCPTIS